MAWKKTGEIPYLSYCRPMDYARVILYSAGEFSMTNGVKISWGLYVHIPFCVSKCQYCDFNSYGIGKALAPEEEYIGRLLREIRQAGQIMTPGLSVEGETVYFGGGTPSLFSAEGIGRILTGLRQSIGVAPGGEVTLEMNPKTASREKMAALRGQGVTRLSVGVQTLDEEILHALGRAHSAADALQTLEWAFDAGLKRVNADLMYGLSGQSLFHVEQTLGLLKPFPLAHLSAYELIVEEGTPFYDRYLEGRLPLPETEEVLRMRQAIGNFAEEKGMAAYEVSNYASAGHESRHNERYWNYDSFLSFGAGAVSFLRKEELAPWVLERIPVPSREDLYGLRWTNPRGLREYAQAEGPLAGVDLEAISLGQARGEFMMMGLRRCRGIRFDEFERKFGEPFPEKFLEVVREAVDAGLMEGDEQACRFTERAMLLSHEDLREYL